ncbi:unnamed protein product [Polarella glacialis]|uniref:RING-type domain-containing protein n=1 Tax=Polarella glacialis TaxID=89957 RepID=A0A813JAM0_POLGL|nr:unnamed protein product [Polarella glacialis]
MLNIREAAVNSSSSSSSSSDMAAPESSGGADAIDLSCTVLRCMNTSGCPGHYFETSLQKALPEKDYVRYTRRSAALQAAAAGLKDLVSCPACDYMVQMSDHSDGVVQCRDPACGIASCRWCREKDHRPLKCDEVEKDGEVKIRTFLEERMAEASLRRCPNPKCHKPYERTEGCNHIRCPCGTHSCYLCGQEMDKKRPYDHYKDGSQGGGINAQDSRCVVYGTPAWAQKSEAAIREEAEEARVPQGQS